MAILNPKNRENAASLIRSGQNFGLNTLMLIGGFVRDKYKGNVHKFSHQMNTQDGVSHLTVLYFDDLASFLKHLPAQTTLVVVETLPEAKELFTYTHPANATYLLGRETSGMTPQELSQIHTYFGELHQDIPKEFLPGNAKTAHLEFVKIPTPQSLNLGVCGAVLMYDRMSKKEGIVLLP